jgi:hypothetical protein
MFDNLIDPPLLPTLQKKVEGKEGLWGLYRTLQPFQTWEKASRRERGFKVARSACSTRGNWSCGYATEDSCHFGRRLPSWAQMKVRTQSQPFRNNIRLHQMRLTGLRGCFAWFRRSYQEWSCLKHMRQNSVSACTLDYAIRSREHESGKIIFKVQHLTMNSTGELQFWSC